MALSTVKRNVIVVGLTDSDKSLIASQICQGENVENVSEYDGSYSYRTLECTLTFEESVYEVTVFDAPGFDRDLRINKGIINQIKESVTFRFDNKVHLVIFVADYGRVTYDIRTVIDQFFKYTDKDISKASAIVFSNCKVTQDARKEHENIFKQEVEWSDNMQRGCYYVHFPDINDLQQSAITASRRQIDVSRKELHELIKNAVFSHCLTESDEVMQLQGNITDQKKSCFSCSCQCFSCLCRCLSVLWRCFLGLCSAICRCFANLIR